MTYTIDPDSKIIAPNHRGWIMLGVNRTHKRYAQVYFPNNGEAWIVEGNDAVGIAIPLTTRTFVAYPIPPFQVFEPAAAPAPSDEPFYWDRKMHN